MIEKASKNTIELDVIGMVIIMVHEVQYTGGKLRGLDLKQSAYFKISGFHFGWPRPEEVPADTLDIHSMRFWSCQFHYLRPVRSP